MTSQYSDEMINAFVDNELDNREKESIKMAMESDAQLYERIKSVCELKKSLKQSYADISAIYPAAKNDSMVRRYAGLRYSAAALILICVGAIIGWYGSLSVNHNVVVSSDLQGIKLTPVNLQQPNKIILHLSSSELGKLEKTLQQVEYIIDQYKNSRLPFEIEIIANSGGIDLLRKDVSPYENKIVNIMNNYDNVSFIACSNAIERLRNMGIEPKMIAHTRTGGTAIEQIVKRLQEGWVYVKV